MDVRNELTWGGRAFVAVEEGIDRGSIDKRDLYLLRQPTWHARMLAQPSHFVLRRSTRRRANSISLSEIVLKLLINSQ